MAALLRGPWSAEVAHWMGLLPLAWLALLAIRGRERDSAWWWLAAAFGVSWLADSAAGLLPEAVSPVITLVYPVSQTALIAAVLLPRREAWLILLALVGVALAAAVHLRDHEPDLVLRSTADAAMLLIAVIRPELAWKLRAALVVYFGLGLVAWYVHVHWLTIPTWYPYQLCRLAGLLLFCWAADRVTPPIRLA